MKYTKDIEYIQQELTEGVSFYPKQYKRLKIEENHPSYKDAEEIFSQDRYKYPYLPLFLGDYDIPNVESIDVNVLRMLIRENNENKKVFLPKELLFLKDFIESNINYHRQYYSINKDAFIHLTIRKCTYKEIKTFAKAATWHVDGFQGKRIPRHIPEQDIIWCNKNPTAVSITPFFCEHLDSSKYDINEFFNNHQNENYIKLKKNKQYLITPYNVHKMVNKKFKGKRVFVRLTFSPVEIEDPTNTQNPMLKRKYPERVDVRNFLNKYELDEKNISGFKF